MADHLLAPLGYCATPGCGARARGHCPAHTHERQRANEGRRTRSDPRLHTQRWRRYSRRYLAEHPWCVGYPRDVHGPLGRLAACTDHIQGTTAHPELFWVETNHQPLCVDCNNRKGIVEEGGFAHDPRER